jgi:plastocyanin
MWVRGIAFVLVLACAARAPASAEDFPISVGGAAGLAFVPATLTVQVGDTVTFTNAGGFHNVESLPGSGTEFRCAADCASDGGTGDPSAALWSFTITLDTAGSVPYQCAVHGGSGMNGTITVEGGEPPPPVAEVAPTSFAFVVEADDAASDTLTVSNAGEPESGLEFNIAEAESDCAATSDIPWLTASPSLGTVPGGGFANSDIGVNAGGLTPGSYSSLLCVQTNDPSNDLIPVPVSLTVTASDVVFADGFDGP